MPASKDDLRKLARGRMSNHQASNLQGNHLAPIKVARKSKDRQSQFSFLLELLEQLDGGSIKSTMN